MLLENYGKISEEYLLKSYNRWFKKLPLRWVGKKSDVEEIEIVSLDIITADILLVYVQAVYGIVDLIAMVTRPRM